MTIRVAHPQDANEIAQVHITTWQVAYRGLLRDSLLDHLSLSQRTLEWQEILARTDGQIFVYTRAKDLATGTTEIVGFVAVGACRDADLQQESVGEVYALYLRPDCWGKGYGAALMTEALAQLQRQGYPRVTLWVLAGNQRAMRFYAAAGFCADGQTQEETLLGGVLAHELRYCRLLTSPVA